jgi:hypothetical protein
MNRRKGHDYLRVFVDLEAKRVLLTVKGEDAGTWEYFAGQLVAHNGHGKAITQVVMDMSPAYLRGGPDNLGNAAIVNDKFQVVSQVVEAVEAGRRKDGRQDAPAREHLAKTCWQRRKHPENYAGAGGRPVGPVGRQAAGDGVGVCHAIEVAVGAGSGPGHEARSRFRKWCAWVREKAEAMTSEPLEPMRKAADMGSGIWKVSWVIGRRDSQPHSWRASRACFRRSSGKREATDPSNT